jgi:hypothetical protein
MPRGIEEDTESIRLDDNAVEIRCWYLSNSGGELCNLCQPAQPDSTQWRGAEGARNWAMFLKPLVVRLCGLEGDRRWQHSGVDFYSY